MANHHSYVPGKDKLGRVSPKCTYVTSRQNTYRQVCNLGPDATPHRKYKCRKDVAGLVRGKPGIKPCHESFLSIEMRDRHEADTHGSGW